MYFTRQVRKYLINSVSVTIMLRLSCYQTRYFIPYYNIQTFLSPFSHIIAVIVTITVIETVHNQSPWLSQYWNRSSLQRTAGSTWSLCGRSCARIEGIDIQSTGSDLLYKMLQYVHKIMLKDGSPIPILFIKHNINLK